MSGSWGVNGQGLHGKNLGAVLARNQLEFHFDALILEAGKRSRIGDQPLALVRIEEGRAIGVDEGGNGACLVGRGRRLGWLGRVLCQSSCGEKDSSGQQEGKDQSFHRHLLRERECGIKVRIEERWNQSNRKN